MTFYSLRATGEPVIVLRAHRGLIRYQCADGSIGEVDMRTFDAFFACTHIQ